MQYTENRKTHLRIYMFSHPFHTGLLHEEATSLSIIPKDI